MIALPKEVIAILNQLLDDVPSKELQESYEGLSLRYRKKQASFGYKRGEQMPYIAARMPATYGAVLSVLNELPDQDYQSVLDLGAGPGTASLAAHVHLSGVDRFTLVEQDFVMSSLSQKVCAGLSGAVFVREDFQRLTEINPHDLVMLSYVLNEHPMDRQLRMARKAWECTQKALVLIVPGTPHDSHNLLEIRQALIDQGAFIAAPCPSNGVCPLMHTLDLFRNREVCHLARRNLSSNRSVRTVHEDCEKSFDNVQRTKSDSFEKGLLDWCHFSVRVERSLKHRQVKKGGLMYEDEKYSYLIAMKEPVQGASRIIKAPLHRKGHVILDICSAEGINRRTVSQRDKTVYDIYKKLKWGEKEPAS